MWRSIISHATKTKLAVGLSLTLVAFLTVNYLSAFRDGIHERIEHQLARFPPSPIPFTTFSCWSDNDAHNVQGYRKPFRFHVYDVPEEFYSSFFSRYTPSFDNMNGESHHSAEIYIWRYLKLHPCHTTNRSQADIFIVPSLGISSTLFGHQHHPAQVFDWVLKQPEALFMNGYDHWALGEGNLAMPRNHMPNINYITPEIWSVPTNLRGTDSLLLAEPLIYFREVLSVVISYPDIVNAISDERFKAHMGKRDKLAVFYGSVRPNQMIVREKIRDQMLDRDSRHHDTVFYNQDHFADYPPETLMTAMGEILETATFGPTTGGDIKTSRRTFSLILRGCIPVMICDYCMLPYEDLIDYKSFMVFISVKQIMTPGYNFMDELAKIPQERVEQMQRNMLLVRKHFVWREGAPEPGDPLDMMVRNLARQAMLVRGFKRIAEDWRLNEPVPTHAAVAA
ncbi:exostosin family-domain-containing protein [Phlyctochytrium arcticum]|nr:exostosin family-domain-containing protein [Phlyctochytrium arcticum]